MSFIRRVSRRRKYMYDDKTGLKVFGRELREDGEKRGVLTLDWDPEHPQRYTGRDYVDRIKYNRSKPNPAAIPATVRIGFQRAPGTNERIQVPGIVLNGPANETRVDIEMAMKLDTATPNSFLLLWTGPASPIALDPTIGAAAVAIV